MSRAMSYNEWMGAYGHLIPGEIASEYHLSLNFTYESEDGSPSEQMHERIADTGDFWYMVTDEVEEDTPADDGWDFL